MSRQSRLFCFGIIQKNYLEKFVAELLSNTMTTTEVVQHLGLTWASFYQFRFANIFPPPMEGLGARKHYSNEAVEQMRKTLEHHNKGKTKVKVKK